MDCLLLLAFGLKFIGGLEFISQGMMQLSEGLNTYFQPYRKNGQTSIDLKNNYPLRRCAF